MVPAPVRRATNNEITVAMAGGDFSGLRVFFASGDNPRGIGQRAPIDTGTNAHRQRLGNVVNWLVGLVDKLDLKNQGVLGIEAKDLGKDDVESLIERLGERLGLVDLGNHLGVLLGQKWIGFRLVEQTEQPTWADIGLACRLRGRLIGGIKRHRLERLLVGDQFEDIDLPIDDDVKVRRGGIGQGANGKEAVARVITEQHVRLESLDRRLCRCPPMP